MNGAREYATLFMSGQYGRLYIESSGHARGKTFHIWVLASEEPLLTHPSSSNSTVEVYGITGGNHGWTETYGWLHRGKWEQDFYALVEKRRAAISEKLEQKEFEAQAEFEASELRRQVALLASYESSSTASEGLVTGSFENAGHNFFVASFPLPADHWLYSPQAPWDAARGESSECPLPVLAVSQRDAVIAAARYAIRGATACGTEPDFDPDALVINLCYALFGPANSTAESSASK